MAYRLHHLHIICRDLEKMITFFTETLEAKLVRRQNSGLLTGLPWTFRAPPLT